MDKHKNNRRLSIAFIGLCIIFWMNVIVPIILTKDIFAGQMMSNRILQSILIGVIIFLVGKELIDREQKG